MKALHNPPPIPIRDGLFNLNITTQQAPINIIIIHETNTVIPIMPVCIHIYTYSESGGVSESFRYLLFAGMLA